MFVERPENRGRMIVDFRLFKYNYQNAPEGIIRIARFSSMFSPCNHFGYYGDIYMKRFIRKWKLKTYENIQRRQDKIMARIVLEKQNTPTKMICSYMKKYIIEYL